MVNLLKLLFFFCFLLLIVFISINFIVGMFLMSIAMIILGTTIDVKRGQ
jgi:hypothetical protein